MERCEVREADGTLQVTIRGAADVASARAIQEELASAVVPGRSVTVVLDEVERLDGAGLQLLFALKALVERGAGRFQVSVKAEGPAKALEAAGAMTALGSKGP